MFCLHQVAGIQPQRLRFLVMLHLHVLQIVHTCLSHRLVACQSACSLNLLSFVSI